MAPPNSKNTHDNVGSDTSALSSTGTSDSYDGGSESPCMSTAYTCSQNRRSRLDSFLSSGSSGRTARSERFTRSSESRSLSSCRSGMSTASGASQKSILKKKKKKTISPRRRSLSKRTKSPLKKKKNNMRPLVQISMVKNSVLRKQVRQFVSEYSKDPDFETFSFSVDGIPFVALSLLNAHPELQEKFKKAQPPAPMKKHTPGANSPRKYRRRRHNSTSRCSSVNSKCVRFTDESCSPKKAKKSLSDGNEIISVIPDQDQQRLPPLLDEKFQLVRLIGDGNTAVVYEVVNKINNDRRAMKVIARENVIGKEHMIEKELSILQKIDHKFIVQMYDHWFVNNSYFLSLELIEMGDLFQHLRRVRRVPEREAVRMMTCLGQALEYIHDLGVVHRDVKLENLLIVKDEFGELGVKLADFGLAADMPEDFGKLTTICGTPTYVAPEVLNKTGYGCKVDIWAAGVILYAILVGFPPFQSSDGSEQDLFSAIMSGKFSFPSPSWDDISWSARHLIMCLIHTDDFHRYSARELLRDGWMVNIGGVDPKYEEWAHLFVQSKMHVEDEQDTPYEYYTSR